MLEKTLRIGDLAELLKTHDVEISSPDGYVPVLEFVDKGMWDEYVLDVNGKHIRCNENHLFETGTGWMMAKDILSFQDTLGSVFGGLHYKCDDGKLHRGYLRYTGKQIPIVDIQVGHENQRYYSDGVSSHNTAVGKSLAMCHLAAAALSQGRNVLYITMEMAEEKIAERIDANLFDVRIDQLSDLSKDAFADKVGRIAKKTNGKLIVKEYPTAAAHAGHFRALLQELKLKKNFVPDLIFIDYLNICASSRIKGMSAGVNSYTFIKAIAEELRGLAVEFNVPIWSATQVTRTGYNSSDVEITDTSESFGLPATADLMIALISTEQLEKMNQLLVKQLKNRYNDVNTNKRFTVGIDRGKMRLYDIEDPLANIMNEPTSNTPVADTPFSSGQPQRRKDFSGFKV